MDSLDLEMEGHLLKTPRSRIKATISKSRLAHGIHITKISSYRHRQKWGPKAKTMNASWQAGHISPVIERYESEGYSYSTSPTSSDLIVKIFLIKILSLIYISPINLYLNSAFSRMEISG